MSNYDNQDLIGSIAIIGMSGRFPGANNLGEFWENLRNGVESVTFFSDEELEAEGIDRSVLNRPNYVKAAPLLEGADLFDPAFFGYSPREAEIMDPQQRVLLECAWDAMENAGYDSERYDGSIGVFAGASFSHYSFNLFSNRE